ncbi:hypothetical protein [Pseudomonas alloputida]|uniref:hypothetical protein n=1 Tax=Pseudomonas TaxID=286 RepID=UPI003EEF288C
MHARKMLFAGLVATLAGCGTIGNNIVSDQELATKAAFALDTTADQVTVSNRSGEVSGAINFVAATHGRKHQCYITTVMGAVSSSAICSGANSVSSANAGSQSGNNNCNALLSAAGQCR